MKTAMTVVGWVLVVLGAIVGFRGWQDAQNAAGIYSAAGVGVQPNYTQLWIGVLMVVVGAVLLLVQWARATSRR